jgi:hypothetical protein
MKLEYIKVSLALLILLLVASAGCSNNDPGMETYNAKTETNEEKIEPVQFTPQFTPQFSTIISRGERIYFNYNRPKPTKTRDGDVDVSIVVDGIKNARTYEVTDLRTAKKAMVNPGPNRKYILASITVNPVTTSQTFISPPTTDFSLVDGSNTYAAKQNICPELNVIIDDKYQSNSLRHDKELNERYALSDYGEIYVKRSFFGSLNKAEGSGPKTGWLIFEVTDSFEISENSYIVLQIGSDDVAWKLLDILAFVSVEKQPLDGSIIVTFDGGAEAQMVRSIEVEVILPGGSSNTDTMSIQSGQSSILTGTKITIPGSKPGEGKDRVIVTMNRRDGGRIVKFDEYVEVHKRGPPS